MSIIRVGWRGIVNTCQGLLGWLGNCIIIWGNNLTSHRFPPLVSYFQSKQHKVSIHVGLILCTHTSQTPRWLHRSQPERQYSRGVAGTCVCYIHVPPRRSKPERKQIFTPQQTGIPPTGALVSFPDPQAEKKER